MFDNENTVEVTTNESVHDDGVQAREDVGEIGAALDAFISDGEQTEETQTEDSTEAATVETEDTERGKKEPSWLKLRIQDVRTKADKAGYERAMSEWQAKQTEYETRLRKLEELEIEEDAKAFAAKEHCSVELAKRVIRMERGIKPTEEVSEKTVARDAQGRFTKQTDAPVEAKPTNDAETRAKALYEQAQLVTRATGVDVLELFKENDEVKRLVGSGEWDFADVAREYAKAGGKSKPPAPVRASNTRTQGGTIDFMKMSSADFEKFQSKIHGGATFKP